MIPTLPHYSGTPPPRWFNRELSLKNLSNPFELLSKFELQNSLIFKNPEIQKDIIKMGTREIFTREGTRKISLLAIYRFFNKKNNEVMYQGIEYSPRDDQFSNPLNLSPKANRSNGSPQNSLDANISNNIKTQFTIKSFLQSDSIRDIEEFFHIFNLKNAPVIRNLGVNDQTQMSLIQQKYDEIKNNLFPKSVSSPKDNLKRNIRTERKKNNIPKSTTNKQNQNRNNQNRAQNVIETKRNFSNQNRVQERNVVQSTQNKSISDQISQSKIRQNNIQQQKADSKSSLLAPLIQPSSLNQRQSSFRNFIPQKASNLTLQNSGQRLEKASLSPSVIRSPQKSLLRNTNADNQSTLEFNRSSNSQNNISPSESIQSNVTPSNSIRNSVNRSRTILENLPQIENRTDLITSNDLVNNNRVSTSANSDLSSDPDSQLKDVSEDDQTVLQQELANLTSISSRINERIEPIDTESSEPTTSNRVGPTLSFQGNPLINFVPRLGTIDDTNTMPSALRVLIK